MPLSKVSEEIQGEIYKKKIYISKHSQEHFRTLSAKFDLRKNKEEIYIYNKLEKHLNPKYNRYGWAWAIDKDQQAELGICFNVQMHEKGTFIIWIKKGFKDIETFLEHYYMVFDFLEYEEHGKLLDLFYVSKTNRKAFDYIHLANKIGPKQTIDKEWKGAEVSIEYFTLKSGKKVINVKIDYSDPHDPELEIQGPEAESRNLRDILVKPAETLPTISNIGIWSLESRNNTKDIKTQHEIIKEHITDHGQILQTIQLDINNNHQDNLAQISQLEARLMNHDLQEELRKLDLKERIDFVKRKFPHLEESLINIYSEGSKERIEIRNALINLIVHLLNLDNNIQGNLENTKKLIEKTFFDTTTEIHNAKKEIVDSLTKKFDSFRSDLQKIFQKEFQNLRKDYVNNLYLIIRAIHKIPDITTKELIKELQDKLDISRSTFYNYLKKLYRKEIIKRDNIQINKKGRPSHIYRISDKIKKLFKKEVEK